MPRLKTYDLFVIHAWRYDDDYDRLVKLLRKAPRFKLRNYSVSQHDPLDADNARRLRKAIDQQISSANAVLIISGMYVNHRAWIKYEIEVAKRYNKPIIGIRPRGAKRVPVAVRRVADAMVSWSTASIVRAIREHAL